MSFTFFHSAEFTKKCQFTNDWYFNKHTVKTNLGAHAKKGKKKKKEKHINKESMKFVLLMSDRQNYFQIQANSISKRV